MKAGLNRFVFVFFALLILCGSSDQLMAQSEGRKLVRKTIRKRVKFDVANFKDCRFDINYNGIELPMIKGNIKIIRDSAIQISLVPAFGIEAGRVLLTRDSIFIINRINKWYIADDLEKAGLEVLGKLKMREISDLFIGNLPGRTRYLLKKDTIYESSNDMRAYTISNRKFESYSAVFFIDRLGYKLEKWAVLQSGKSIAEMSFLREGKQNEPEFRLVLGAKIQLNEMNVKGTIHIQNTEWNKKTSVGVKIGRGYKRRSMNELRNN